MNSLGNIVNIDGNIVTIKINSSILGDASLMNIHVVFDDGKRKIAGEIIKISLDSIDIAVVGEFIGNVFIGGIAVKPSFKSIVRIVTKEELAGILGKEEGSDTSIFLGRSSVYQGYKINVDVNALFSNHFSIIGNTGSGKSCTFARIIQNVFTTSKYLPVNASIFIFDAYGEYKRAFSYLHEFNDRLNFKAYTTDTYHPDSELLRIPLWLLNVDDLALLLGATEASQIPIIEKALKLVPLLIDTGEESIKYKNDIIARALLDILKSGRESIKIRDQITAVLTSYNTKLLNLESEIIQPGYVRTLKQCIYVDNSGKMQEMELVVNFLSTFIYDGTFPNISSHDVKYSLSDLEQALNFALISEGILKSDKVFDYANVLSVRLHSLVNSENAKYFEYDKLVTDSGFINDLLSTGTGGKCQLIDFNINYVDDRIAKVITKIISRILFDYSVNTRERGKYPFHIIIEEAHRYVQNDIDTELLGYNIFDRITKEGRKYGVILGLITQRPSELSDTSISQCTNFLILRTLHPKDLQYIKDMVPNVTDEIVASLKTLQPGNAIAFGGAFKVPTFMKMDIPNPEPLSNNSDIARIWYALQ